MSWLNCYAWLSLASFVGGALNLWWRTLGLARRGVRAEWRSYLRDAPPPQSAATTVHAVFLGPAQRFHRVTRRSWALGYACYHVALISVIAVYALCACSVLLQAMEGRSFSGVVGEPSAGRLARTLLLIFSSGDPAVGRFLFGDWNGFFVWFGWGELALALVGNGALLIGWFAKQSRRQSTHLAVRLLIFAIIQTEWLGRLQLVPWATQLHTLLGLTLLLIAPYCYLAHIYLAPVVIVSAWRRHRLGVTA